MNAMLNIAETGYTSDSASEPESADPEETEENDDYIDYEVVSETLDNNQTFMRTTTSYDNTGNYVVTENDESGAQKFYDYDVNGNTTSVTNMHGDEIEYQYDAAGNVISESKLSPD